MITRAAGLATRVPSAVTEVCATLADAGHQAVTVGGAVRDALLGRPVGDWDVATSALPQEVVALFPRTIPTGIQHGTVTVLAGRGAERMSVEVTSYRGEGAYSDSRRPDQVRFGVGLTEDLARRDFVINAIAFDPVTAALIDPFGGQADLRARIIRAVGDPAARFAEDGLRVMRAVRFVAQLDFALDPATQAAIGPTLPSLAKVSRERVRVELVKLLGGPASARALELSRATGLLGSVLPEAAAGSIERAARVASSPRVAMAALLCEAGDQAADAALRRLTFSNADRQAIVALVRAAALPPDSAAPVVRRALAEVGRAAADDLAALLRADRRPADAAAVEAAAAAGDPLTAAELALKGGDLIAALGLAPGPEVGRLTAALLDAVLDDPARNTRDGLIDLARTLRR